jgi:hypothetical protein
VDVRKNPAFLTSRYTLPGDIRRAAVAVESWAADLPAALRVLVYCVHGHEVSKNTHRTLRARHQCLLFTTPCTAWCCAAVKGQTEAHNWIAA